MSKFVTDFSKETQEWYQLHRYGPNHIPSLELHERLLKVEERLLILHPNEKLHDKYQSLKEAYENYKIIERLISNDET